MMNVFLTAAVGLVLTTSLAMAEMTAKLDAPWNGKQVPAGQNCRIFGGAGSTPPMQVAGIPAGTVWLVVEFNDRDFGPLSKNGGHGIIGFPVRGSSAKLPAVPGMTDKLPGGARVLAKARSTGNYASPGYLPPCSGGRSHRYFAEVKAVDSASKVLAQTRVEMGRY
jgi:phosphatidylethanolamine-binding protein (PEBP) family uncharacterized protein